MATLVQYQRYFLLISLLIFNFKTLAFQPYSSFSLQNFNPNKTQNFDSNFSLLGDAQISNDGNFVHLSSPSLSSGSSSGQIVYKKTFKFLDSRSFKPTISFSTDFSFTISPGDGDGIAFVIFPRVGDLSMAFDQGYFGISNNMDGNFVAVEFDTRNDDNVANMNGNHVNIDVGKLVGSETTDVSPIGLVLNGGNSLKTWIDYEPSSKRLEVRLGENGSERPYKPLISTVVDLPRMWGDEEILVGISSSSNANSRQRSSLHSWSFSVRSVSSSLHSEPLNPEAPNVDDEQHDVREKSYFLTVLGTLIFATGCGTLVAFVALFFWVVLYGRHSNVAPELPMNSMEFKYEKVNLTIDNGSDDNDTTG